METLAAAALVASMHCKMPEYPDAFRWECSRHNPWAPAQITKKPVAKRRVSVGKK